MSILHSLHAPDGTCDLLCGQLQTHVVIKKVKNIPWIDIRTKISSEYNEQAKVIMSMSN